MLLMEKSPQVTVSIDKDVSEALDAYCHRKATKKKLIVTRVVAWFLRQESTVQSAIISVDEQSSERDVQVLEAIAKEAREVATHMRVAASQDVPDDPPAKSGRRRD